MTVGERQEEILRLLKENPTLTVSELSKLLYVSEPTVRRDFTELDAKGLIRKKYGGAVPIPHGADCKVPLIFRENEKSQAKTAIGRQAAALIPDGSVIFLDASTSAFHLVPFLAEKKELIAVTSGAKTAVALAEAGIPTYSTGGKMLLHSYSYIGAEAERFLKGFYADFAFFSCRGVSSDGFLSDSSEEELQLRRVMMEQSAKTYALLDHGKQNKSYCYRLCHVSELSGVISDTHLSFRKE